MKLVLIVKLENGNWISAGCPHVDDWIKEPTKRVVRLVTVESAREDYSVKVV